MKKILALLMALSMIAVACGDSDPDTPADSGSTDTTAAADPGDSGDSADPIEIEMWIAFSDDARLNFTQDRAAEFNEQFPDYEVIVTSFDSYNTVFEQTTLAIDDGSPPEIIHFFEAATQEALDAVDANGDPIFASVTAAVAGRTEILDAQATAIPRQPRMLTRDRLVVDDDGGRHHTSDGHHFANAKIDDLRATSMVDVQRDPLGALAGKETASLRSSYPPWTALVRRARFRPTGLLQPTRISPLWC